MTGAFSLSVSAPHCVAPVADRCGEAAVWSPEERALYWCDVHGARTHRLDERTGAVTTWSFDEPVVALSLTTEPGRLLVGLASKLVWWWPETDERRDHGFRLPNWPEARLNDGRADARGRFWIGSMFNDTSPDAAALEAAAPGTLYRIDPDGAVTRMVETVKVSNTICWSPDGGRFYFADSPRNVLSSFAFDGEAGTISGRKTVLVGHPRGIPDGSAVDAEGYIWNCRYLGGCILRIAPDGTVDRIIEMPTRNITTCVFGGPGRMTLYVTSAANDTTADDALAGALWRIDTNIAGLAENRVAVG